MAGRTKENIPNTEAERTKETPSKLTTPRAPVGAMNKDPRFPQTSSPSYRGDLLMPVLQT